MSDRTSSDIPEDKTSRSRLAVNRFLDSMEMNYEKWHDGVGYDLTALDEMTQSDKDYIAEMLISSNQSDPWRKFETLEYIKTARSLAAINSALRHPSLEVRIAASRFARGADEDRERVLIEALEQSDLYEGLTQALDQIETFHPPGVIDALLRGLLKRDSVAVNFAGMLFYIFGKADSSFDWNHRPFFLRFSTGERKEREQAFIQLCNIIGVDPKKYIE